jgi:hypothetical protein
VSPQWKDAESGEHKTRRQAVTLWGDDVEPHPEGEKKQGVGERVNEKDNGRPGDAETGKHGDAATGVSRLSLDSQDSSDS